LPSPRRPGRPLMARPCDSTSRIPGMRHESGDAAHEHGKRIDPGHHRVQAVAIRRPGLARCDGLVVFCDRALPGQTRPGRGDHGPQGLRRGTAPEVCVALAGSGRALLSALGQCGGCAWQDLPTRPSFFWKREQVAESLRHMAASRTCPWPTDNRALPRDPGLSQQDGIRLRRLPAPGLYRRDAPGRICE
jgi:hypothetical protein